MHVFAQSIDHVAREDDLPGFGESSDTSGHVHRVAVDVAGVVEHWTVVTPDVDPQCQSAQRRKHRQLHRLRRLQGTVGVAEVAHQPVAHALDDLSAVIGDGTLKLAQALVDAGVRLLVAESLVQPVLPLMSTKSTALARNTCVVESLSMRRGAPDARPTRYVIWVVRVDCSGRLRG